MYLGPCAICSAPLWKKRQHRPILSHHNSCRPDIFSYHLLYLHQAQTLSLSDCRTVTNGQYFMRLSSSGERQRWILFLEMPLLPKYIEGSNSSWSTQPTPRLFKLSILQQQRLERCLRSLPLLRLVRTLAWCLIHAILTHAILADQRDYAVELNNFFQGHPTGNLTKYFRYEMTREGRDDAPTHIATAKCEYHHHDSKSEAV